MTITSPAARPAPLRSDEIETRERVDAAAKPILRARWQRDVNGALVCRWVPE